MSREDFIIMWVGCLAAIFLSCNASASWVTHKQLPDDMLLDFAYSHTYDRWNYNCFDYSRDAVSMLKANGYIARQVIGKCEYIQGIHGWVEVSFWYEPQTGRMIRKGACYENR